MTLRMVRGQQTCLCHPSPQGAGRESVATAFLISEGGQPPQFQRAGTPLRWTQEVWPPSLLAQRTEHRNAGNHSEA